MPRAGVSTEVVVRRAAEIIDHDGVGSLSLARIAEDLGVSAPSLYKHVGGIEDLTERVAGAMTAELASRLGVAVRGKSGRAGLGAIAHAYRDFVRDHPGSYPLTQRRSDSPAWLAAAADALDSLTAVVSSYSIPPTNIDVLRFVRSALHGFTDLERTEGFGLPTPVEESFEVLIDTLDAALRAAGGQASASLTSNHTEGR